MIYPNSLKTALLAIVLAGISAVWGPGVSAQTPHTACSAGGVTCLDQGWDDTQRSWWYSTSQGSRLLPLSWALSLKTEDGRDAMFGPANLSRLGYLSNPVSRDNPHGLPVGFVVDEDRGRGADLMCDTFPETCLSRTMRTPWIGLNCAACHTAEIAYGGTVMRIDGAPANADFDSLVSGTEAALRATRDAPDRWAQFARAVLGSDDADAILSLRTQVDEQIGWMARLSAFNASHVIAGPARLDAQGHILAKVAAINGAPDAVPVIRSDAPASYPFIWNTHQQEKLQWNGIADAVQTIRILGHDTGVGALIRNTSEVIGVFAHVEADRGWAALGYDSSVRVTAMVNLERQLARLNSPLWPEALLGPIDTDLAAQGAEIFDRSCASCHAPLGHGDLTTPAGAIMVPLNEAGTDVFLACNTFLRTADAGNMARQRTFGVAGERIAAHDVVHKMLVNAAVGAVLGKLDELIPSLFRDTAPPAGGTARVGLSQPLDYLPEVADAAKRAQAKTCLTNDAALLAYKARPLNGIWATAPFLHNGSVPTLYDLLLPARLRNTVPQGQALPDIAGPVRPERFGVGSRDFDPVRVGFVTDPARTPWTFDVRDADGLSIPGNSNAGHDYGNADFSEADRMALVEYLKGL